ncbi:MAG: N-acetylmuramic acid 6-phosphate etherase, partial [Candidatus Marsarchaeota archaeon]
MKIEDLPVSELVRSMVTENRRVIEAVEGQAKQIEEAVNYYAETVKRGGKVVYFGAGTSGRIGFMDAVELYPTFGVGKETVVPL